MTKNDPRKALGKGLQALLPSSYIYIGSFFAANTSSTPRWQRTLHFY